MLHSAANNAYSWWWASHLRKKQSKWLEQNLQEVEEKVQSMLKIIEQDGDSFAKRAEMYYKKRPELIDFVEESYRAYRALAERYDLLSRELQTANHTLATVAPDQQIQQLSLIESTDDDDDDATSMSMSGCTIAPSPSVFEESFEANSLVPAALSAVNNITARENNISKTEELQLEKEGGEYDDQLQVKACNIDDDALPLPLPLPEVNNETKEEEEDKGTQSTGDNISTLLDIDYIVQEDELDEKNTRFQEQDGLDWRQLYLNNTDQDRERTIMVEEYTNILREYKDVKMKLNQVERKNCDNIFELASHVRELRIINAAKDEEITMLRNELAALRSELSHKNDQLDAADTKSLFHHMLDHHNYNKDLENMSLTSVLGTREFTRDTNICGAGAAGAGASSRPNLTKAESRLRAKLDDLFEANRGFWLRFSTSFNKIHKFQTSIKHLQEQSSKLREAKKQDTDHDKKDLKSDAKLLYKHLRETQTNLTLWLEHNAIFEQELKTRFLSLNNIEEEITVNKASNSHTHLAKNDGGEMELISDYHAAKFQGEVLNMKQENNKVFEELHAGIYGVNVLMMEVDGELSRLDKEFGSLLLKYKHPRFKNSLRKPGIPLQSFLFGAKSKKQRKQSIFGWMT